MEKSESSDSDSNCSTSWVLVYDNTPPLENANRFHLDCSREPIQELTEQDLLSAGSDLESDTDGVSVISESEAAEEELNEKTCEETSDLQVPNTNIDECTTLSDQITLKNLDKSLVTNVKKLFTNANMVGVGVVLTAVFLGSYTMIIQRNSGKDTTVDLKNFINYEDEKINPDVLCKTDAVLDNQLEEIVDMTIACTYDDQGENDLKRNEIKQCVKVYYENKKSIKHTQVDSSLTAKNEEKDAESVKIKDKIWTSNEQITDQKNEEKKKPIDEMTDKRNKSNSFVRSQNKTKKYLKDKHVETSVKSKYNVEKKSSKDLENEFRPKYKKSKHETHTRNPKVYKSKFGNSKRSYEVKFKSHAVNIKKNSTSKEFKDLDRSGEWYSDWHKARRQLRKHDLVDEHYPNKKKTKMQWYFKWMNGREELRYKKNYRPYSS